MTMADDQRIAAMLHARLAQLTGQMGAIDAELSAPLDADFADQAVQLEGQDALAGIEATHRGEAEAIRAALVRLADGQYGSCARCGQQIAPARLLALPSASLCIMCAT